MSALDERDKIIKDLLKEVSKIPNLLERIKKLEEELALYKKSKDSSNSHKPPSSDMNTPSRNKSLREKSGKKPGGQHGHDGSTLRYSDQVDEVIKHTVKQCTECGKDISTQEESLLERRQEVDIPLLPVKRTEHQTYGKQCSCGHFCCCCWTVIQINQCWN